MCLSGTWCRKLLAVLFASLVLLGVGGCATAPALSSAPQLAWSERQQQLLQLQRWSFSGRLAVKDANNESWSASLRWQQDGDRYDIQLSGAFGQGAARLFGHEGHAVIEMPKHSALTAESAEALMQQQLGWYMPVQGLKYWLRGTPEPGLISQQGFNEAGRLQLLQQSGWQVTYSDYLDVDGLELPRKLALENPRLRARLVIDRWQLPVSDAGVGI
ncbi:MAG TPA: outer membrane lipoprotein LolB [Candidatus Tenderia electrophaga]|uniref:Outer-membrane lipoprotein LolB n=1 Tax=Candidatus Tenderia electrophaga TaxID=1748243 RepID=A0A832N626_9GAMM|nr:outer membrane lipoprotein LolB [Candidatus Tenderia electrophaga]